MKLALLVCSLLLAGCLSAPPEKRDSGSAPAVSARERDEARQALFLAMVTPESCYQHDLTYAVRDPDFLERVLARLLAGRKLEDLIRSDRTATARGVTDEVAAMLRQAPSTYAAELRTPDGLSRIEKTIADRFTHPVVDMQHGLVMVDYGHVAARLTAESGPIGIDFAASPHLNHEREWQTAEIAAAMESQLAAHPDAQGVRLRILIPGTSRPPEWFYEYARGSDRVRISWDNPSAPPLESRTLGHDFTPYRSGAASLSTRDLQPAR